MLLVGRGRAAGDVGRPGEVIAAVKQIPAVAGVHLLTAGYEKKVPELLELPGVADSSRLEAIALDAAAQAPAAGV